MNNNNSDVITKIEAVVLEKQKTLYYDDFITNSAGLYVASTDEWKISSGRMINHNTDQSALKDRLDFFCDLETPISVETSVKFNELNQQEDFVILQLFTNKNYGNKTYGDGYGLLLKLVNKTSAEVILTSSKEGEIKHLLSEKYSINPDLFFKLRLKSTDKKITAYIDDELILTYKISSSKGIRGRWKPNNASVNRGGVGLIKGSCPIEIDFLRIFTEKTKKVMVKNLKAGWIVKILDPNGDVISSQNANKEFVIFEINDIVSGKIKIYNNEGKQIAETLKTHIIGGDVYKFLSISLEKWIEETEEKLFSETFWREDDKLGGIIARLGNVDVFTESTEFVYFYYLLWKYLIEGKDIDLIRINKIRALFDNLRINDEQNPNYGLFYERFLVEKGVITSKMTRNIVLGSVARFIAHYYLLTGDNEYLNQLTILLDKMIDLGIIDPEHGTLKAYDPLKGTMELNSIDVNSPYLHGYNINTHIIDNEDINIKNSYIIDAYILGYSLTGNEKYLETAKNITDWLILNNYDANSRSFPKTSTHDTMEFLEVVWSIYLITNDDKYYEIINDSLNLYFNIRHRGKLTPFRYYSNSNDTYNFDTLTPSQLFIATKIGIWNEDRSYIDINKHFLAYLYNIRTKVDSTGNTSLTSNLLEHIRYKIRGWYWSKNIKSSENLWHFRYSALTHSEVRDKWAPDGNWMSFTLSYLLGNLYSLKYGALTSIFPGRYFPGQPYIAFTQAKIIDYKSTKEEVRISFNSNRDFEIRIVIPDWGKDYDLYIDDALIDQTAHSTSNKYGRLLTLNMKAGKRILNAKSIS